MYGYWLENRWKWTTLFGISIEIEIEREKYINVSETEIEFRQVAFDVRDDPGDKYLW